jgi:hypothetical protein
MRIVLFIGSPISSEKDQLVAVGQGLTLVHISAQPEPV